MQAVVYARYGSADVLHLEERDIPIPRGDEVLIEVHATSVNASDVEFLTASPAYIRAWGLFAPKHPVLGSDIAGRVEAVGANVSAFAVGDRVFGDVLGTFGGFAEYACAPAGKLTKIPGDMSYGTASTLPQAACVALQGIRDKGATKPPGLAL